MIEKNPHAAPKMLEWLKIWAGALTRPTPAGYAGLFGPLQPQRITALAWLVTGGVAAALLTMLTYAAPLAAAAIAVLCALPVFTLVYIGVTVLTARSALWIARQMAGGPLAGDAASLDPLLYRLAAINAPMSILSALAYLLPYGALIANLLGLYWVYLTILAVKSITGLSWGRAALASVVFILAALLVVLSSVGVALLPGEPF